MQINYVVRAALALFLCLLPTPLLAASLQQESPAVAISPSSARPGQTVHVAVSGLTAPNHVNTSLCVGILGPGRNVELGRTPAFRPRVGEVTIGANGAGQTDVRVPTDLVSGSYQLIVGGCARQPDLAPLATLAAATLTVTTAAPTPAKMPATGGVPENALPGAVALGLVALVFGVCLRRRRLSGTRLPLE